MFQPQYEQERGGSGTVPFRANDTGGQQQQQQQQQQSFGGNGSTTQHVANDMKTQAMSLHPFFGDPNITENHFQTLEVPDHLPPPEFSSRRQRQRQRQAGNSVPIGNGGVRNTNITNTKAPRSPRSSSSSSSSSRWKALVTIAVVLGVGSYVAYRVYTHVIHTRRRNTNNGKLSSDRTEVDSTVGEEGGEQSGVKKVGSGGSDDDEWTKINTSQPKDNKSNEWTKVRLTDSEGK